MLILTRHVHEKICIGDDIVVTVLSIKRNRVEFGIEAPRDVSIDREEIALRKREERRIAK